MCIFTVTEQVILNGQRFLRAAAGAGKCVEALRSIPKKLVECVLKKVAVGLYNDWIEASVREVQRSITAGETIDQMDEDFDNILANEFDREYLAIMYGAKG